MRDTLLARRQWTVGVSDERACAFPVAVEEHAAADRLNQIFGHLDSLRGSLSLLALVVAAASAS